MRIFSNKYYKFAVLQITSKRSLSCKLVKRHFLCVNAYGELLTLTPKFGSTFRFKKRAKNQG